MTHSLRVRLTLFFLVVAMVPALIMFLVASVTRTRQFQSLIAEQETSLLEESIRTYYTEYGSLDGFSTYLRTRFARDERVRREERHGAEARREGPDRSFFRPLGVVDASGQVVIPTEHYPPARSVPPTVINRSTPVIVDSEPIAFILPPEGNMPFPLRVEEQLYLERTSRALLLATVGAVLAALFLGAMFARTLTRPIHELISAADALRQGSLGEQVTIHLRDELGHLAATFNQMSTDLALATHARRQMTADIAHDLRTPLQIIGGYIDAMVEGDLEPTHERLTTVYTEITHLQRLVADLHMLSQADAGELSLNRQAVQPQALLERVTTTYANQAAQQDITLTYSVAPDMPPLYIDEDRIMQVLNNLFSNALRHTPAGGRIALAAYPNEAGVCLQVQDNGAGIAADDLPYVFHRFYRGDRARQDEAGASGLGLAIARALVELHNGTITVTSPGPGAGTTLAITLPVGQQE